MTADTKTPTPTPTNPWAHTATGAAVDLLAPTQDMICPLDISQSLSMTCRFSGAAEKFISVAEHSVNVARHLAAKGYSKEVQLHGLLHDAHEAYLGDMTTPVRRAIYASIKSDHPVGVADAFSNAWSDLKTQLDAVIFATLGLPTPDKDSHNAVGHADRAVLMAEREQCLAPSDHSWGMIYDITIPAKIRCEGLPPRVARDLFLRTLADLSPKVSFQQVRVETGEDGECLCPDCVAERAAAAPKATVH
jgi:uncharacterized protein